MNVQHDVISALTAAADQVDSWVAGLDADQWALPTPSPGWTVAHQIAHLSFVFTLAGTAVSDPDTFAGIAAGARADFDGAVDAAFGRYLPTEPSDLLRRWRSERTDAIKQLAAVPSDHIVPWLARPLRASVLAAAGLLETFAHGQDIADTIGVTPVYDDGLAHIVEFAVHTWDFGYQARGMEIPAMPFRFEITAPSGVVWTHGPASAEQRICGPAVDLALLVSRRRNHGDLRLTASGGHARRWLEIAQAYRGPAGAGREPGQFARQ